MTKKLTKKLTKKYLTKKYLIRLADSLRDPPPCCEPFTQQQLEHLANFCLSVNPAFKRERWLGYISGNCGPSGGKK